MSKPKVPKPRNSAQVLADIEKLLKVQNLLLRSIDNKLEFLSDIKLKMGANYRYLYT